MRGKQGRAHPARSIQRITPARAGKTYLGLSAALWRLGSPPRVRGKQIGGAERCCTMRITPARAGKTACRYPSATSQSDHPRACGENTVPRYDRRHAGGSPPRVRGKRLGLPSVPLLHRITPARAGKTHEPARAVPRGADHPRACGENWLTMSVTAVCAGSPPRVRGKRSQRVYRDEPVRITPARAGKTNLKRIPYGIWTDHPRACGENFNAIHKSLDQIGSPPRVRGKH